MKAPQFAFPRTGRPLKPGGLLFAAFALPALLLFPATHVRASDIAAEKADDATISTGVKIALLHNLTFSFLVRTHDGVVTLTGSAADAAEREANSKIAAGVSGVKGVLNQMIIPTAVARND